MVVRSCELLLIENDICVYVYGRRAQKGNGERLKRERSRPTRSHIIPAFRTVVFICTRHTRTKRRPDMGGRPGGLPRSEPTIFFYRTVKRVRRRCPVLNRALNSTENDVPNVYARPSVLFYSSSPFLSATVRPRSEFSVRRPFVARAYRSYTSVERPRAGRAIFFPSEFSSLYVRFSYCPLAVLSIADNGEAAGRCALDEAVQPPLSLSLSLSRFPYNRHRLNAKPTGRPRYKIR